MQGARGSIGKSRPGKGDLSKGVNIVELARDWEELRDRYSNAAAHPTPRDARLRRSITTGLWSSGVPYKPPQLTDGTIRAAVREALTAGGPAYVHPGYGPIADWNVSAVTNMNQMFTNAAAFNGDLSGWDVKNVARMDGMFQDAAAFNGNLGGWVVDSATNMSFMFKGAAAFNCNLSGWNVSRVTNMVFMFQGAAAFNGDLSGWDVGAVRSMLGMFQGAVAFNGDLRLWNVRVHRVESMARMFQGAAAFNGDLSGWDVGAVRSMLGMFQGAVAFNGDLSLWDVRNVENRDRMFQGAVAYLPAHALGSRTPPPPLTDAMILDAVDEALTAGNQAAATLRREREVEQLGQTLGAVRLSPAPPDN